MDKDTGQGTDGSRKWLDRVDVAAKLIGALAVAYITWIAKDYESKMSATTLLSQREQAESSLRAGMLHDLVGPIIGQPGQKKEYDPERERLLVELLTLNFHDHFEFKPLLVEVDKRLARSGKDEGRRSLESVARRVIDRQVNMLGATARALEDKAEPAVDWYFEETQGAVPLSPPAECQSGDANKPAKFKGSYGQVVCAHSPDDVYRVDVTIRGVDFDRKTVKAYVNVARNTTTSPATQWPREFEFVLTPFDFPLTDNTEIDPEHRFALMLYHIRKDDNVQLKLVWFPKGYITERERPVNYLEVRKVLGVEKKANKG
jgi:hypothetical protein